MTRPRYPAGAAVARARYRCWNCPSRSVEVMEPPLTGRCTVRCAACGAASREHLSDLTPLTPLAAALLAVEEP